MMTLDDFKKTLADRQPAQTISACLQSLWLEAKGDWEKAHAVVQDLTTSDAAWVHAYLHRKEGDISNATYWYHRADKPVCKESLEHEWEQLVQAFL